MSRNSPPRRSPPRQANIQANPLATKCEREISAEEIKNYALFVLARRHAGQYKTAEPFISFLALGKDKGYRVTFRVSRVEGKDVRVHTTSTPIVLYT